MKTTEQILSHIESEMKLVSSKIENIKLKLKPYETLHKRYLAEVHFNIVVQLERELIEEGTKYLLLNGLKDFIQS